MFCINIQAHKQDRTIGTLEHEKTISLDKLGEVSTYVCVCAYVCMTDEPAGAEKPQGARQQCPLPSSLIGLSLIKPRPSFPLLHWSVTWHTGDHAVENMCFFLYLCGGMRDGIYVSVCVWVKQKRAGVCMCVDYFSLGAKYSLFDVRLRCFSEWLTER